MGVSACMGVGGGKWWQVHCFIIPKYNKFALKSDY